MMAMSGMRPAAMVANVPATMQAAIAVPAMMAAAMPMRVPVSVTAPDLEQVGSSLDMFGSGRGRACRAGSGEDKSRGGGPGNRMYLHESSLS